MKVNTLFRAIGTVCAVMYQVMVGSMVWLSWCRSPWEFDETVSRFADSPFVIIFVVGFFVVSVLVILDFLGLEKEFVLEWDSIQVDYPQGEMAPIEECWYQAKYGPIDLVVEHYALAGEWSWRVCLHKSHTWQSGRAATADEAKRDAEKFLKDQFEVTK